MKIYLMRHAHAEPGDRMDAERGLTDKGRRQCEHILAFFESMSLEFDLVLSSAFERASQTAEYFVDSKHDSRVYLSALEPDGTPEDAWAAVEEELMFCRIVAPDRVLIVTHDPLIQPMLAYVCFGFSADHNLFDHANVVHLDDGVFKWWMSPKLAHKVVLAESEREFVTSSVKLAEHLAHRSVRRLIDPLIAQLRKRVAARFRAHGKAVKVSQYIDAPVVYDDYAGLKGFGKTALAAYIFGAQHAGLMLGWISEAKRKTPAWISLLPGIIRLATDVEADIDGTTDKEIGDLVRDLKAEGVSEAALLKAVRGQFQTWAAGKPGELSRAEKIATTEIATAYHHGMRDVALRVHRGGNGPVEKAWEVQPDACPVCEANAQQGYIDAEAPFTSGHFEPPAHPNCRCSLIYRTIE